jgi:UDP-glucuronate 4-epimerase
MVILRYFSVYGPRQRPDMAFNIFCRSAIAGRSLEIYGDGRQTRDFTFVGDVVAATQAAGSLDGIAGGVFNVGGGSRASLRDVIAMLEEIAGRRLDTRFDQMQRGDVRDTGADIAAARAQLGFEPGTALPEGLRAEFEWTANESRRVAR